MISKLNSVLYQTILVKSIFASFGYNPNKLTIDGSLTEQL